MKTKINHLGVIMDGNRRWAKKNSKFSVLVGHEKGAENLIELSKWCIDVQIPYLTVYAFSTENWNRSSFEIKGLFKLLEKFFNSQLENCINLGVKIKIVGNKAMLDDNLIKIINDAEKVTENCQMLTLQIALSYGGRDELIRAIKKIGIEIKDGIIDVENITEAYFEKHLDTSVSSSPDFDMIIRTGGNHRLSNFFPWQSVYAELYFTDVLWPDFSREDFNVALEYYDTIQINKGK